MSQDAFTQQGNTSARAIQTVYAKDFLWCLVPLAVWLGLWLFAPEPQLFLQLNRVAHVLPEIFWASFNMLGNGWGVFALACPLLVLAPRLLPAALVGGAISGILSNVLKQTLEMPRPAAILDPSSFYIMGKTLTHFSMPSGHTLTAFAILTAFYFSIDVNKRSVYRWLFVAATLAGLARIAVGAHWPADVCAGAAVGLFSGIAGARLTQSIPTRALVPQAWLMRIISTAGLVGVYILLTTTIDFPQTQPVQWVAAAIASISIAWFTWRSFGPAQSRSSSE
jgi:membrane-associated phospholipid phosphatase